MADAGLVVYSSGNMYVAMFDQGTCIFPEKVAAFHVALLFSRTLPRNRLEVLGQ